MQTLVSQAHSHTHNLKTTHIHKNVYSEVQADTHPNTDPEKYTYIQVDVHP